MRRSLEILSAEIVNEQCDQRKDDKSMDSQEKLHFWRNEIERAEQYGFHFDVQSMKEIVDTVENLLERLENKMEHIEKLEQQNILLYGRLNNIRDLAAKKIE